MPTRSLTALLFAAATAAFVVGCEEQPKAPPPATGNSVLMTIDGIEITFADVEPFVAFLTSSHPEVGRKTVTQTVLEKHLVPLRLAERAFGQQRAALRQQAADLRSVATNSMELERQTPNLSVHQRKKVTRLQPDIAVARFLFDPLMYGGVCDPIAVPRGFVVTAVHDYVEVPVAGEDMVDATQVGFFTHTVSAWAAWMEEQRAALADKVTYVHPDFREAIPTWCNPPK